MVRSDLALTQPGGREAWRLELSKAVVDRPRLIKTVEEQIVAHKLGRLPVANLLAE